MRACKREPLVFGDAPQRPLVSAIKGSLLVAAGVQQGCAFIKGEHDVGTDLMLHLHGHFGREPMQRTIEV